MPVGRPAASAAEMLAAVADSGILCLAMMLRFLKLPADPAQIRHDHAPTAGHSTPSRWYAPPAPSASRRAP
ncbi:MAG: hypothetical protein Kow00114_02780 [Kiloniellaceae bacterium]